MTPQEALTKILAENCNEDGKKWYTYANPPYKQSTGASTALRVKIEQCTISTMRDFFGRFGYEVKIEVVKK